VQPLRMQARDRTLVIGAMGLAGVGLLFASLLAAWYVALLNLAGLGLIATAWLVWKDR
jgi:hypothetical protein